MEEYAPYIQPDGLVTRIHRHEDLECGDPAKTVEEIYENRHDLMYKIFKDCDSDTITEYFHRGRDDAVKS